MRVRFPPTAKFFHVFSSILELSPPPSKLLIIPLRITPLFNFLRLSGRISFPQLSGGCKKIEKWFYRNDPCNFQGPGGILKGYHWIQRSNASGEEFIFLNSQEEGSWFSKNSKKSRNSLLRWFLLKNPQNPQSFSASCDYSRGTHWRSCDLEWFLV